ncbi:MAG: hypothetical protein FJZ56_02790 [Chlamydiae bacterium]|nr:hypothetical protein [Chlamydiota bacterium]
MNQQTRQIFVVTTTTAIGFLGNVLSYSLKLPSNRKHSITDFKFVFPKGVELFYVLSIGFVAGLVINKSLQKIENNFKTKEEKLLEEATAIETEKALAGVVLGKTPVITWV